jgi:hypothetical protein
MVRSSCLSPHELQPVIDRLTVPKRPARSAHPEWVTSTRPLSSARMLVSAIVPVAVPEK